MTIHRFLLFLFVCGSSACGSTKGEQTYRFLFKSGNVIWIAEDIGGAYELSILHQITLNDDAADGQSPLSRYADWSFVGALKERFHIEPAVALKSQDEKQWGHSSLDWTLHPPAEDASLDEAFAAHVHSGGDNAETFYAAQPSAIRHPPILDGIQAEPLFFAERGLFFNYTLATAWYFPRSGLLLVFTHQPTTAVGLDTMHGFILMKVSPDA